MALIHWWPLNNTAIDRGCNSYKSYGEGSYKFVAGGVNGYCLERTSKHSVLNIRADGNIVDEINKTGEISISFWVKPAGNHVHYTGTVISSGNWNNLHWAIGLGLENNTIDFRSFFGYTNKVSTTISTTEYTHVVVTVKRKSAVSVFVNGVLIYTAATTANSDLSSSDIFLRIGSDTYTSGYFGFNGLIADVRIYDNVISTKEVYELYKCCVVHYDFEDLGSNGTELADSSGLCHNGTYNCTSTTSPIKFGTKSLKVSSTSGHGFSVDLSTFKAAISNCTVAIWCKINSFGSLGFVAFGSDNTGYFLCSDSGTSNFRGVGVTTSNTSLLCDGKIDVVSKDGKYHLYTASGVNLSNMTSLVFNGYGANVYNITDCEVADFKIYFRNLTNDEVAEEYRSLTQFANDNSVWCPHIEEKSSDKNMIYSLNELAFAYPDKSVGNDSTRALSAYNQSKCTCSATSKGFRIYREPNILASDRCNYGGLALRLLNLGNKSTVSYTNTVTGEALTYTKSDFFTEGHRYILSFDVDGFSNNALAYMYFTNYYGWAGTNNGLGAKPRDDYKATDIPANFGIVDGKIVGAHTKVMYDFTITDTIYKTCTKAYSSFKEGNIYPVYRDLAFGFTYTDSGEFGTDIYLTNFSLIDVTVSGNELIASNKINILQQSGAYAHSVVEALASPISFTHDGSLIVGGFHEF